MGHSHLALSFIHTSALFLHAMLRAGVLALAITASSLDDTEFDAEAWKAQKDEELKFLLKVRELAHEHAPAKGTDVRRLQEGTEEERRQCQCE